MRFWDSSALLPLIVDEPTTASMREILSGDRTIAVWWGGRVECASALARRWRVGALQGPDRQRALSDLDGLWKAAGVEVVPSNEVRSRAEALLGVHPLRAADALQLAAAVTVFQGRRGAGFVCLDGRLRDAASGEGFAVLPEQLR